jgi:DNA (cytosine-5)-methyltransferase 1
MKLGSLFSGIGGFELGLERAIPGLETIWQVEQDKFCQRVLSKHWPHAKIYNDVRNITKNNVEPVDMLCGGFPCQDISVAGKGKGINEGEKSSLWWEMHRIISELRPRIVVLENVPAITFRGLDDVLGSLAQIGYDAEWTVISAAQFGAPHKRERWFCVAYPNDHREINERGHTKGKHLDQTQRRQGTGHTDWTCDTRFVAYPESASSQGNRSSFRIQSKRAKPNITIQNYWERFPTQSPLCDRNDGIPNRLARLRALGNAIVPQCSQWIGEQILNSGLLEELK